MSSPSQKMARAIWASDLPTVFCERIGVKALQFEHDRPERQDDEKQPLKVGERADRLVAEEEPVRAEEAQRVRSPERRDHEEAIGDLEELEIEFLFSTEHRRFLRGETPQANMRPDKKFE